MAIVDPDFATKFTGGYSSSIVYLRGNLAPKALSSLRRLTHVLRPPLDAPRALEVASCAIECVKVFGKTISQPSDCFIQLIAEFDHFATSIALIKSKIAACITNDFSVVPGGKPYYAQVSREEIWSASNRVFGSLGWGEPVALNSGLAAGSRIAPTRESA